MRSALVLAAVVGSCSSSATAPPVTPAPTPTSTATPPAVAEPKPPAFRLPGDVRPKSYKLELTIAPAEQSASGHIAIDALVVKPTRVVWLDATELAVTNAKLGGQPAQVIAGGDHFVGLVADRELPAGALEIQADFAAKIDHEKSRGIYAETEGTGADAKTYAYSFFEATDARRAFPCFDEPSYKVPWQLTFHVRKGDVALANAPVTAVTDEGNGMQRVETAQTPPLPSYLVAFVVGPFEIVDGGKAGLAQTPIRFIIPQGRAGELGWAKNVTPRVVVALETYFAMPYPYGKLDVAVVPRYWGTMEHPGIVAMGQPLTLIRPDQQTRPRMRAYANILAHELSHYWFGDYVTMAWWDDTWLNEALGEWSDMNITDAVEPSWRYRDRKVGFATGAMDADEALATQAIRQPVTDDQGIEAAFDSEITYAKGSSVFRMFEAWIGPAKWRDFIHGYLAAHAWGNASADDFFAAVRAQLGADAEAGLRSFIEQPGVPRIAGELACSASGNKLVLRQSRALPAGTTDPVARTWTVPVCVRYGDGSSAQKACALMTGATAELALPGACPTWWLLNADANGYYRSAIDLATAGRMFQPNTPTARAARPTAAEKLMIVSDLRAAVDRGELSLDKVLALAPLIAADADDKVALAAFHASSYRSDILDDALYAKARASYAATFGPIAHLLGWQRRANDSEEREELRRAVMQLARYDATLANQATQLASNWLEVRRGIDGRGSPAAGRAAARQRGVIDDDMVDAVFAAATYHGDAELFDQLLAAARTPRDRSERQRVLAALGGFTDPALVARALELVRSNEFDLRDSLGILYGVVSLRETRATGVAFISAHIDELLARMRDDEASWFLSSLVAMPCEPKLRDHMGALVQPRAAKYAGAVAPVTRGLEKSQQCITSFERELPALEMFLTKR